MGNDTVSYRLSTSAKSTCAAFFLLTSSAITASAADLDRTPTYDPWSGLYIGGMVRANFQVSPEFVLGLQVDGNFNSDLTEARVVGGLASATLTNEYLVAFSGRAGVLVNPETLAYAIGGYSIGEFDLKAQALGASFGLSRNVDGFHVGAGLEAAIDENWTLRAEYRFTQFDKESFADGLVNVEPSMHAGQIGVAYNFRMF